MEKIRIKKMKKIQIIKAKIMKKMVSNQISRMKKNLIKIKLAMDTKKSKE